MKNPVPALALVLIMSTGLKAQDTLPNFSVVHAGNHRAIVSWTNLFTNIRQISIQRSFDSLTNYKTILTVPDPSTKQNGYLDNKAPNDRMFYRIYVMLEKGIFLFSPAKRPSIDTMTRSDFIGRERLDKIANGVDSISNPNFGVNSKNNPNVFKASVHVYTYKDGYVRINLPDDEEKKYNIKFFEDDGTFIFELKDLKPRTFKIDKANFYHAGWFRFELYEDGKLIEKHKFHLEKDF